MNTKIRKINTLASNDGLCVPRLSVNDGNCLYDSLCYHRIAPSIIELKTTIAYLLLFFKSKKNFLPRSDISLEDMFAIANTDDSKYVYCHKSKSVYQYNYDLMCLDIISDDGWARVHTQIIFNALSVVMNIKFVIYHSNGHKTVIYARPLDGVPPRVIWLGHINECHYIPLDKMTNPQHVCPQYTEKLEAYTEWIDEVFTDGSDDDGGGKNDASGKK